MMEQTDSRPRQQSLKVPTSAGDEADRPAPPFRITIRYLVAVAFIYLVTAGAWLYLGAVTHNRTMDRDYTLRAQVGRLWGGVHNHVAPAVTLRPAEAPPRPAATPKAAQPEQGKASAPAPAPAPLPEACLAKTALGPAATDARVDLALQHRRKGLLWYSTYGVKFDGTYTFNNASPCPRAADIWVPFPASGAIYDEFALYLDGEEVAMEVTTGAGRKGGNTSGALARVKLGSGSHKVRMAYRSRGMDRWNYSFGADTARAKDFKLAMKTNFNQVDFPAASLSPSQKRPVDGGWELTWSFGNLLADAGIAVDMPQRINPGPLSAEISRFAPVSLFFFFFVLLLVAVLHQVRMHPVHFGMLAAAFFAFHLLMAYLVDHLPLWLAFTIASVTSVGLVTSYLRLAVGTRFALLWAGGAQLLYLVLFSLAFFLEGYTGLTITIFSVLTLFVVMQLTGRIDWATKFGGTPAAGPAATPPRPMGGSARRDHGDDAPPLDPAEAQVFSRVG